MTRAQHMGLARQVMTATAEREAEQRRQWADNAQRNAELWAKCVPLVQGDSVTLYIERRGFDILTQWVHKATECGKVHRVAQYVLMRETGGQA